MIRVAGEIRVPARVATTGAIVELCHRATILEQKRERRFGELRLVEVPRKLARFCDGDLVLPRAMMSDVRELCAGVPIANETTTAPLRFAGLLAWRPNQVECARALVQHTQMIAIGATGSGKTGAGCASIEAVGQRTLILAPTVDLCAQWAREIHRFLGVAAGVCTAGEWTDADVVVATPTTALRHEDRLARFGLLIVDEVQGFATDIRCGLIGEVPALYRLALTATLPKDHRGEIIRSHFGEVRCTYAVCEGVAAGVLVTPIYKQVETYFVAPYAGPDDWASLQDALVDDKDRNEMIVETVVRECAGAVTLVLSQRLAHLDKLASMLEGLGPRVGVLSGAVSKAERERVLADTRAGKINVLLASTVADEGIDLPMLGALVLAFPGKSEPRLLQRIGRVLRAVPGKPRPLIFDFVDNVGPLRHQARIRAGAFARTFGAQPRTAA